MSSSLYQPPPIGVSPPVDSTPLPPPVLLAKCISDGIFSIRNTLALLFFLLLSMFILKFQIIISIGIGESNLANDRFVANIRSAQVRNGKWSVAS